MTGVPSFTDDQVVALTASRDKWMRHALDTGPFTSDDEAIAAAYRAAGLKPPQLVVRVGSPFGGHLAVAALTVYRPASAAETGGLVAERLAAVLERAGTSLAAQTGPGKPLSFAQRDQVNRDLRAPLAERVTRPLLKPLRAADQAGDFEEDLAQGALGEAALKTLVARLREHFPGDEVGSADEPNLLWLYRDGEIDRNFEDEFGDSVRDEAIDLWDAALPGHWDAERLARLEFFTEHVPEASDLDGVTALVRASGLTSLWWPFEHIAVLSERPVELHFDAEGRLHREGGPAVVYPDNWNLYAVDGEIVPLAEAV